MADIGDVIEYHLRSIGLIKDEALDEHQKKFIEEKRAEFDGAGGPDRPASAFPEGAKLCAKCQTKAMIMMDGCLTCLNCGDSKCA